MRKGLVFCINKSFARVELLPEPTGLLISYVPVQNGEAAQESAGAVDIHVPIEAVGGLWATTRAFLYGVESLDENVILRGGEGDILIKLYRDKPTGQNGRLSGEEVCWLRIVTGRTEEERRRLKLGPKDLLCLELACNAVLVLSNGLAALANGNGASSKVTSVAGETEATQPS